MPSSVNSSPAPVVRARRTTAAQVGTSAAAQNARVTARSNLSRSNTTGVEAPSPWRGHEVRVYRSMVRVSCRRLGDSRTGGGVTPGVDHDADRRERTDTCTGPPIDLASIVAGPVDARPFSPGVEPCAEPHPSSEFPGIRVPAQCRRGRCSGRGGRLHADSNGEETAAIATCPASIAAARTGAPVSRRRPTPRAEVTAGASHGEARSHERWVAPTTAPTNTAAATRTMPSEASRTPNRRTHEGTRCCPHPTAPLAGRRSDATESRPISATASFRQQVQGSRRQPRTPDEHWRLRRRSRRTPVRSGARPHAQATGRRQGGHGKQQRSGRQRAPEAARVRCAAEHYACGGRCGDGGHSCRDGGQRHAIGDGSTRNATRPNPIA